MTEEQTSGVPEELAAPATEDMTHANQAHEEQQEQQQSESDADRNWRALREQEEQARRKADEEYRRRLELEYKLKAMEEASSAARETEPEEDYDPDDLLTRGEFERQWRQREEAKQKAEQQRELERQQAELPKRIESAMPDFNDVVNDKTIEKLRTLEPEVAQSLGMIGDPYAQAVAAYKYIKTMVRTETPEQKQAKEQINENAKRPGSLSNVGGGSPLSEAGLYSNGLTPELKEHLRREMSECAKRA